MLEEYVPERTGATVVDAGEFIYDLTTSKIARNVRLIKADGVAKDLVGAYRKATANPGL